MASGHRDGQSEWPEWSVLLLGVDIDLAEMLLRRGEGRVWVHAWDASGDVLGDVWRMRNRVHAEKPANQWGTPLDEEHCPGLPDFSDSIVFPGHARPSLCVFDPWWLTGDARREALERCRLETTTIAMETKP